MALLDSSYRACPVSHFIAWTSTQSLLRTSIVLLNIATATILSNSRLTLPEMSALQVREDMEEHSHLLPVRMHDRLHDSSFSPIHTPEDFTNPAEIYDQITSCQDGRPSLSPPVHVPPSRSRQTHFWSMSSRAKRPKTSEGSDQDDISPTRQSKWSIPSRFKRRKISQESARTPLLEPSATTDTAMVESPALTDSEIQKFHHDMVVRCKSKHTASMIRYPFEAARDLLAFLNLISRLVQSNRELKDIEPLGEDCVEVIKWIAWSPVSQKYSRISTGRDDIILLFLQGLFDDYEDYSRRHLPTVVQGLDADIRLVTKFYAPMYRDVAASQNSSYVVEEDPSPDCVFDYNFFASRIASLLGSHCDISAPIRPRAKSMTSGLEVEIPVISPRQQIPHDFEAEACRISSDNTRRSSNLPDQTLELASFHAAVQDMPSDQQLRTEKDRKDSKFAIPFSAVKKTASKLRSRLQRLTSGGQATQAKIAAGPDRLFCPYAGEAGPSSWKTREGQAKMLKRDAVRLNKLCQFKRQLCESYGRDMVKDIFETKEDYQAAALVNFDNTCSKLHGLAGEAFAQAEKKFRCDWGHQAVDSALLKWENPDFETRCNTSRTFRAYVMRAAQTLDPNFMTSSGVCLPRSGSRAESPSRSSSDSTASPSLSSNEQVEAKVIGSG